MDVAGSSLDERALRARLVAPNGPYAALDVVASTGSTNVDLVAAAEAGAADRTVLIADSQTAGQGRLGRRWVSPPGTGLYLSVLLRLSGVPATRLGWLPLLASVALLDTLRHAGVQAVIKWPNDVLAGASRAKCAGVLAQAVTSAQSLAVVLGIGLNVLPPGAAIPAAAGGLPATSLAAEGAAELDRTELATLLLGALASWEQVWRDAGGDAHDCGLRAEYRAACATIGQAVRVELPGDERLIGIATDIDADARLILDDHTGRRHHVSAGDVVHLRAMS